MELVKTSIHGLKILISAYACSPFRGSEPGMGWNFIKEISKHHSLHVIIEENEFKNDIEKYLILNQEYRKIKFHYIPRDHHEKLRKIWPPSYYYFYRLWHKKAYQLADNLDKKENFDVVHQLNMVGFREPGYLWKIDKPFVWGPIGGMQNTPWRFFSEFDFHGKLFYGGRNLLNSFQMTYLKRPRKAASRDNSCLIAATPDIKDSIYNLWKKHAEIITEVGAEKNDIKTVIQRKSDEPINIVWSGQHTAGKALNILLKSLDKLSNDVNWHLDILGSGRMSKKWKKLARDLDLDKNCTWHGWLDKNDAFSVMKQGHLFCVASLKDLTSTVLLEAIALGLPVVCLDHCGFKHVINEKCGINIPVTNPKEAINGFLTAIEKLYFNEELRQQLAQGALNRSLDFSWEGKIEKLNKIYAELLNENTHNP